MLVHFILFIAMVTFGTLYLRIHLIYGQIAANFRHSLLSVFFAQKFPKMVVQLQIL